jgi:N-methylhydantoinase B
MASIELPLEILWPRLVAIADEMATTLIRTAFSHDVIEVHDMSTGLYDDRGFLIGQSWLGATGHVGVMPVFGKSLLEAFPPETIEPGDIFVCNDPWLANGQTADVFITTPAFLDGRLLGFSVNSVHHVDIGGRAGSSLSEEVFEEGLVIPHLKLYRAGKPNDDFFALLKRNVRFVDKVIGDIRAQIATGHVGVTQLEAMARDYRLTSLQPLADEITLRSEMAVRRSLAELPDGAYAAEMSVEVEGIDRELKVALKVTIRGDELEADFTGTSPQVRRPVNSPINYTRAYVAVPTKLVCDPYLPNNEGTYRPISIKAPPGSLVNPTFPAATFWRLSIGMLVGELMFRIFSVIAPSRVPADSGSVPTWQFYVSGSRANGEPFALHQHAFGGMGGRPGLDGLASVSFPYNVRDVSVEWSEAEAPVLFEKRELIIDSGGAGKWRGGLGEELVLRPLDGDAIDPTHLLTLSGSAGRMRNPAQGLLGGLPGSVASIHVGTYALAPTASPSAQLKAGETLSLRLPGGGGYGPPSERDRTSVAWDVKNGYVSPEQAVALYGFHE